MDDEQSLLRDPEPDPAPSAAEAFARLSERVAGMEERLDGRMAMMTRALEHIAIEKQSIEIPDYSPTLAKIGGVLATLAGQTQKIMDAPAIQLTPEGMADQIGKAARAARETDRATIEQAQELHRQTHADQMRSIGAVRTKREQRLHMLYTGMGAALAVMLLWLAYPGWAASSGPRNWLWPERTARRVLGEPTLWDAGIRLMRAGNPDSWQAIMDAAEMRRENSDAIAACQTAAVKAKESVRCTIRVGNPSS